MKTKTLIATFFAMALLLPACNTSRVEAWYKQGVLELSENNQEEAIKWLTMASDKKHAPSIALLDSILAEKKIDGLNKRELYEKGQEAMQKNDTSTALFYFNASARQNYAPAKTAMGYAYKEKRPEEAHRLFIEAAAQEERGAQREVISYYLDAGELETSIGLLEWIVKSGNSSDEGQRINEGLLGVLDSTRLVPKAVREAFARGNEALASSNHEEAAKYYRVAAEQDHAPAQLMLGTCYTGGIGVAVDQVEAVKWFRKASDRGNIVAWMHLGMAYAIGKGVEQDRRLALEWLEKAYLSGGLPSVLIPVAEMLIKTINEQTAP
ncbi:MAG: sel1 repeat family protein [Odoribacteraceae bacterium]|jgi:TPR repeat protein|nr:sel1 repeat family protein [Odoribacteraceae bacterium]